MDHPCLVDWGRCGWSFPSAQGSPPSRSRDTPRARGHARGSGSRSLWRCAEQGRRGSRRYRNISPRRQWRTVGSWRRHCNAKQSCHPVFRSRVEGRSSKHSYRRKYMKLHTLALAALVALAGPALAQAPKDAVKADKEQIKADKEKLKADRAAGNKDAVKADKEKLKADKAKRKADRKAARDAKKAAKQETTTTK